MSKNDFALYKNLCGKVSLSGGETLEVYREGKWLTYSVFQHNVNCCFFFFYWQQEIDLMASEVTLGARTVFCHWKK